MFLRLIGTMIASPQYVPTKYVTTPYVSNDCFLLLYKL